MTTGLGRGGAPGEQSGRGWVGGGCRGHTSSSRSQALQPLLRGEGSGVRLETPMGLPRDTSQVSFGSGWSCSPFCETLPPTGSAPGSISSTLAWGPPFQHKGSGVRSSLLGTRLAPSCQGQRPAEAGYWGHLGIPACPLPSPGRTLLITTGVADLQPKSQQSPEPPPRHGPTHKPRVDCEHGQPHGQAHLPHTQAQPPLGGATPAMPTPTAQQYLPGQADRRGSSPRGESDGLPSCSQASWQKGRS